VRRFPARSDPYPQRTSAGAILFALGLGLLVPLGILWWVLWSAEQAQRPAHLRPIGVVPATGDEAPAVPTPQAIELHSQWVSQTGNPVIAVGETATVSIVYRNTGQTAWLKGTAAEARLGVENDDPSFATKGMAVGWLSPVRPTVQQEDAVYPGQTGTFAFKVIGKQPGTTRLDVRLLVEGVTWMEDQGVHVNVNVR
jgi:hypothetical protein